MKNYEAMTKRELQRELEMHGELYLPRANVTKKDMIDVLRRMDEARGMTPAQLMEKIERRCDK